MSLRSLIALASAAAVVGVLPSQEPFVGHGPRVAGEAQPVIATRAADWVIRDRMAIPWNPVPTRIQSYPFGENTNPGTELVVQTYVGDDMSCVQVAGGPAYENVTLYCATELGRVELPFGTFLLGPQCIQIPGVFNDQGVFDYEVDLARAELRNTTFHFQAMEIAAPTLSKGMSLRYVYGNPQPPLGHTEPRLTAILHKDGKENGMIPILYRVLLRFEAEASYQAIVDDVWSDPGYTDIYVRLKSPGGPKGAIETHRKVVDLGLFPEANIRVWVGMDHAVITEKPRVEGSRHPVNPIVRVDNPWWEEEGCRCYALAAVIDSVF